MIDPFIAQLISAFTVGLLGGVHCIGMCGGIAGALGLGIPANGQRLARLLPLLSAYNTGRIASYTFAGAIAGSLGAAAADLSQLQHGRLFLEGVAALFMIALGLYLGGWWFGVARLERAGGRVWRYIEPLARRLLPVRHPLQALSLGLVWGWIPCGLVYTALIWSVSAGGTAKGALLMLAFGLGTLPNLMAMGLAAARIGGWVRRPGVRRLAGALVIGFGTWTLARAAGITL